MYSDIPIVELLIATEYWLCLYREVSLKQTAYRALPGVSALLLSAASGEPV